VELWACPWGGRPTDGDGFLLRLGIHKFLDENYLQVELNSGLELLKSHALICVDGILIAFHTIYFIC
jgi:hypothetical protein